MDRVATLKALFDTRGRGIEIGASYNPLLPKSEGYTVETIDVTDQAGLIAKYGAMNLDTSRIESVDHIFDGRPLQDIVGRSDAYDFVFASHVVEHTPDLIAFLRGCGALLKADGVLVLAVPDKRYCFDIFQPLTSTGAVLQAHVDGRTRPTSGAVFDDLAYQGVLNGEAVWGSWIRGTPELAPHCDLDAAARTFESHAANDAYHDVHVWRFVPSSFRLIIEDLFLTGATELREARFHPGIGCEFYAVLSRNGSGPGTTRQHLLQAAQEELAAPYLPAGSKPQGKPFRFYPRTAS